MRGGEAFVLIARVLLMKWQHCVKVECFVYLRACYCVHEVPFVTGYDSFVFRMHSVILSMESILFFSECILLSCRWKASCFFFQNAFCYPVDGNASCLLKNVKQCYPVAGKHAK